MTTLYELRNKYTCKSWDTIETLQPKVAWELSKMSQADPSVAGFLQVDDKLFVEANGAAYDLRVERSGSTVRTMRNIQLQGLASAPDLWAKVSEQSYDVYLYLLDGTGDDREIHVDVFYPASRFESDRPGPTTVEIL